MGGSGATRAPRRVDRRPLSNRSSTWSSPSPRSTASPTTSNRSCRRRSTACARGRYEARIGRAGTPRRGASLRAVLLAHRAPQASALRRRKRLAQGCCLKNSGRSEGPPTAAIGQAGGADPGDRCIAHESNGYTRHRCPIQESGQLGQYVVAILHRPTISRSATHIKWSKTAGQPNVGARAPGMHTPRAVLWPPAPAHSRGAR
jgi:hypothetical protein